MSLTSEQDTLQDSTEKRYLPRWKAQVQVAYKLDDDPLMHSGTTKNISCSGACISTSTNLTPFQKIQLTITFTNNSFITVKGYVVWLKMSTQENDIGISFINTGKDNQNKILQYVSTLDHVKLQNHWFEGWD